MSFLTPHVHIPATSCCSINFPNIYCIIHSLSNSYITAASTPADQAYGYVFNNCTLTVDDGVSKVYLGRPWRDYGHTLFMNCHLGNHIRPEGWHHWKEHRQQTARYMEFGNEGEGADITRRVGWSRQLTKKEARKITRQTVLGF